MKLKILYCTIISVFAITSACESDVINVRLPEYQPKLEVTAFLSPSDTIPTIHIGLSQPLYGDLTQEHPIGVISGFISNGIKEVALDTSKYGNEFFLYHDLSLDSQKMKIEYGRTYTLRVSTTTGYTASATCSVPEKRSFDITIDTLTDKGLKATASFKDIPGEEDYYRMKLWARYYTHDPHNGSVTRYQFLHMEKKLFSDDKIDGQQIVVPTQEVLNYLAKGVDSSFIIARLYHTEKSYYLYHQSLDNYQDDDIPFVEPTQVYSNIEGGLGIFTSYTVDSVVFRLK